MLLLYSYANRKRESLWIRRCLTVFWEQKMAEPITTTIALNIISNFILQLSEKGIKKLSSKSPIKKAILKTVGQFRDIENLEESLENWLERTEVHKELLKFEKGNRDIAIGNLSKTLVEKVGFYYGVKSTEKAGKILNRFFINLNEEYLKSEEATLHLSHQTGRMEKKIMAHIDEKEERQKLAHHQITSRINQIDKKLTFPMSTITEEEHKGIYAKRINEAKSLLEEGKVITAKKLNLGILDDIQKDELLLKEALFRVFTNLACCEWELENNEGAIKYFENAYDVLPEGKKARTNLAISKMLKGNPKEGIRYVDEVLTEDPEYQQALNIKSILLVEIGKLNEATSLFNEDCLLKLDSCLTFAQVFLNARDFEKAKKCLNRIKSHFKETPEVNYLYGQALSYPLLEKIQNKHTISWLMDQNDKDILRDAHKSFSKAIEGFRPYEVNNKLKISLLNRSAVSIVLAECSSAIQDCNEILSLDKKYLPAFNNKGIACILTGDFDGAIDSFQKALDIGGDPLDLIPKLCRAYLAKRTPQNVISVISKYFPDGKDITENLEIGLVLGEAYIFIKKYNEAESHIQKLTEKYGQEPSILSLSSKLKKSLSNKKEAEQLLIRAIEKSKNGQHQMLILVLADLHYEANEFNKAFPLYKQVVKKDLLNPFLNRYAYSLYRADELNECFELCSSIRHKYGVTEFISELEAAIHEELGNLGEAENIYSALISKYPENSTLKMKLGMIYFRQNRKEHALSLLDEVKKEIRNGVDLARVANVYYALGLTKEAIEIGYRALTLEPQDPQVHITYIYMFLLKTDPQEKEFFPDRVGEDTVVKLKCNNQQETWTLVGSDSIDPTKSELSTLSGVGKNLLGRKKGDIVEIESAIKTKIKYEILSVENKYVHKFREVLANFRTSFIEEKAIQRVEVGKDLKEIFNLVDQTEYYHTTAIRFYKSRKLTIGALSKIVDKNIFETWSGLINEPDLWFKCDTGSPQDQNQEGLLACISKEITIDLLGLFTLNALNQLELLLKMYTIVYASQSTKDDLDNIVQKLQMFTEGYTTISKLDDKYYREKITPETIERNVSFIKNIKRFLESNCQITGVNPKFSSQRRILAELHGYSSVDPIFVSKERNIPLFSDDLFLRRLGQNDYNVIGFSSQGLLRGAHDKDILSMDEFHSTIEKLLLSNYNYIGISGHFLLYIARKSFFNPADEKMHRVLKIIESPVTTPDSALNVLTDFIMGIWIDIQLLHHTKPMYLDMTLKALTRQRSIRQMLRKFRDIIQIKCKLIPIHASQIMQEIDNWEKSQPIIY